MPLNSAEWSLEFILAVTAAVSTVTNIVVTGAQTVFLEYVRRKYPTVRPPPRYNDESLTLSDLRADISRRPGASNDGVRQVPPPRRHRNTDER